VSATSTAWSTRPWVADLPRYHDLPDDLVFYVTTSAMRCPAHPEFLARQRMCCSRSTTTCSGLVGRGTRWPPRPVLEHAQYLTKRLLDTGYFDILNGAEILPVVTSSSKNPLIFPCMIYPPSCGNEVGLSPRTRCHQMPTQSLLCASSSDRTSVAYGRSLR